MMTNTCVAGVRWNLDNRMTKSVMSPFSELNLRGKLAASRFASSPEIMSSNNFVLTSI